MRRVPSSAAAGVGAVTNNMYSSAVRIMMIVAQESSQRAAVKVILYAVSAHHSVSTVRNLAKRVILAMLRDVCVPVELFELLQSAGKVLVSHNASSHACGHVYAKL